MENKITIVNFAIKALDEFKKNPELISEDIIKKLINKIEAEDNLKFACISAMNRAIKYKQEKPRTKDKVIIERIMKEADEIIESVKEE